MKRYFHVFSLLLTAGSTALLSAGQCKTTPVQVTISPIYTFGGSSLPSMIYPDSASAYVDGVAGVTAYINTTCTNDLILGLNDSTRHVGFSFQNAAATNSNTPTWTPTQFMAAGSRFVVANLMRNYSPSQHYQFTTAANIAFTPPGGKSNLYNNQDQICFANLGADVYRPCGDNLPNATAILVVTHTPADPTNGTVETWTITPDLSTSQLGTLLVVNHNSLVNGGQFKLPFQFVVTRK